MFYPRSLWVVEVVCSLGSCPKCSECSYTENLTYYGPGSNLTGLRSPKGRRKATRRTAVPADRPTDRRVHVCRFMSRT